MMMFETSKHVPKTEKRCCVLKKYQINQLKYSSYIWESQHRRENTKKLHLWSITLCKIDVLNFRLIVCRTWNDMRNIFWYKICEAESY